MKVGLFVVSPQFFCMSNLVLGIKVDQESILELTGDHLRTT